MLRFGKNLDGNSMSRTFKVKRRIEKVRNLINDLVTDSVSTLTLHSAEDLKMLIRTIIDLKLVRNDSALSGVQYHMVLVYEPAGVAVVTPSVSQILDQPAVKNLVWEDAGTMRLITAVGDMNILHLKIDTKGMRKMTETDELSLLHVGDITNSIRIVGTITFFFKE